MPLAAPTERIATDRERARSQGDQCADRCFFATVDATGEPRVRTLVLRDINDELAVFYNGESPKAHETEFATHASCLVFLPTLGVQYRMQVRLKPIDSELITWHWRRKPDLAKKLDLVYSSYPQSTPIPSSIDLERVTVETVIPSERPPHIAGFYLVPTEIERLELRDGVGLHDRRRYRPSGSGEWEEQQLVP